MKWLGSIVKYVIFAVYAVCGLALLTFMVPATGLLAKSVATGSMQPAIPTGSLVIVQKTPTSKLAVGDIVTYKKAPGTDVTITHRIVGLEKKSGIPYFVTKGDANPASDIAIPAGVIIGKVIYHVPYVGAVTSAIKTPIGLLAIVILPGLLIIIVESHRLKRLLSQQKVHEQQSAGGPPNDPPDNPPEIQTAPKPESRPPAPSRQRGLDGMAPRRMLAIAVAIAALSVGTTRASFTTNTVTLKNTHLSVATPSPSPTPNPGQTLRDAINAFRLAQRAALLRYQGDIRNCLATSHPGPGASPAAASTYDSGAAAYTGQVNQAQTSFGTLVTSPGLTSLTATGDAKYLAAFDSANSDASKQTAKAQAGLINSLSPSTSSPISLGQCLATAQAGYQAAITAARDQFLAAIHAINH